MGLELILKDRFEKKKAKWIKKKITPELVCILLVCARVCACLCVYVCVSLCVCCLCVSSFVRRACWCVLFCCQLVEIKREKSFLSGWAFCGYFLLICLINLPVCKSVCMCVYVCVSLWHV